MIVKFWHFLWSKTLSPQEKSYWDQPADAPRNWLWNAKSFAFHVLGPIISWILVGAVALGAFGFLLLHLIVEASK